MRLSTLINEIGDDNVRVQFIDSSIVKSQDKKDTNDTEITIATNEINSNQAISKTGKVGVVIWLDRDQFTSAFK